MWLNYKIIYFLKLLLVPCFAVFKNTRYKVADNITRNLILASSPFITDNISVEIGSPVYNEDPAEDARSDSSELFEFVVPPPQSVSRNGKSFTQRPQFDYTFEEPLYNVDTEPRFFKKTFEALAGILNDKFSNEDVKQSGETKEIKTHKKTHQVTKIKPVKFPHAMVHNYQEVPHNNFRAQTQAQQKQQHTKPSQVSTTFHNSWKPSQRYN